jgi:hypothetical protein
MVRHGATEAEITAALRAQSFKAIPVFMPYTDHKAQ